MTAISHIWNRLTGTTWGFRWQYRLQRWRRAWRYATAAERIANKWTGSGDISCEARGCAVDLIAHYARTQGIQLIERDNEPAVT